jgi:hypothetical protein
LSKEEALRRAIEESELVELGNWEGLGAQLASSTSSSGADCPRVSMVPWSYPWDPPPHIDLTGDDDDDE